MMMSNSRLCLIGFGEAGGEIAGSICAWRDASTAPVPTITTFDIKSTQPDSAQLMRRRMDAVGVECVSDLAMAVAGAQAVISVVTADMVAITLPGSPGQLWDSAGNFGLIC